MDRRTQDSMEGAIQALRRSSVRLRQGVITDTSPLAVKLGDSDVAYDENVRIVAGLDVAVDDVVTVLRAGHQLIILGQLTDTPGGGSFSGDYGDLTGIPAAIDAIDGLTPAADKLAYYTSGSAAALATLSSFIRTLLDDTDAATARGTLGLGTAATHAHTDYDAAGAAAAAQAASQPLDSDLTAIAALTTTSFGRSVLELANAGAGRTLFGLGTMATEAASSYQPIDSDLTAIAALTTTSYGRSVLELADAAAARTLFGLVIGTNVQAYDADLAAIAALTTTSYGRSVLEAADASALRTLAGLVIGTNVQAFDSDLASIAALTTTSYGRSLLEAANASALRTLAGLVIGTDVAAFADSRIPTQSENDALVGSYGTPSGTVPYVTDTDPRVSAATPTLSDAILSLDPALYWTLGSGGSGLTDQSGNGRNGTGAGSIAVGGGASLTSDGGASTDFDGTDDKITSSYAPFTGSSKRTFIGWANPDTFGATVRTLFAGSGATTVALEFQTAAIAAFFADTSGASKSWTNPIQGAAATFAWALRFDEAADTVELFINGVSRGVVANTVNYPASPGNFQLGIRGTSSNPFDGKMAHVAVYEKALSDASITWLATLGLGRGGQRDWGLVTALPTPAIFGDRCSYIADSTNGVIWQLVYDGQGSYPWKYIGGPPLFAEVTTSESTASTSYVNLTTTGPSITLPLAGDFDIEHGFTSFNTAAGGANYMSYAIGGSAASDNDYVEHGQAVASTDSDASSRLRRKTGLTASSAIVAKYKVSSGTGHFYRRWMAITPVRVG